MNNTEAVPGQRLSLRTPGKARKKVIPGDMQMVSAPAKLLGCRPKEAAHGEMQSAASQKWAFHKWELGIQALSAAGTCRRDQAEPGRETTGTSSIPLMPSIRKV